MFRQAAYTLGAAILFCCLNLVMFLFQGNCDNRSEMRLLHKNSLKNIFSFFMPVDGFFIFIFLTKVSNYEMVRDEIELVPFYSVWHL